MRVLISENSGNGPNYHVDIIGALDSPGEDKMWQFIVDGSPLQEGAVIFAEKISK